MSITLNIVPTINRDRNAVKYLPNLAHLRMYHLYHVYF